MNEMEIDKPRGGGVLEAMETDYELKAIQKEKESTGKYQQMNEKPKSKSQLRCEKIMSYIWATGSSVEAKKIDSDIYLMTSLRELFIYLIFVTILMIIAFGGVDKRSYYYSSAVENTFILDPFQYGSDNDFSYMKISNFNEFWAYLEYQLPVKMFDSNNWFNKKQISQSKRTRIMFDILLVGVPRLRQVRSHKIKCLLSEYKYLGADNCYDDYNIFWENNEPIVRKPPIVVGNETRVWKFSDSAKTQCSTYFGSISFYGGGGYLVDLTNEQNSSAKIVRELKEGSWIDRSTRAVFVDFMLYNANLNLFCKVRLVIEFPNFGGAVASYSIRPAKLLRYVSSWDYFILSCEILYIIFIVYYTIGMILEIKESHLKFFKSFWNILDVIVVLISLMCITFNIYRGVLVSSELSRILQQSSNYPHLDHISYYEKIFQHMIAFCVFFVILKIFKYIRFNRTMTHFSSTLGRSMREIFGFVIMFLIVFGAFAQTGYLLFGGNATDFREFKTSILSQFRIILGDFNFPELAAANNFLGEVYFVLYVFFVFFVLINMFLAIICDNYVEVKHDETINEATISMTSFIKSKTAHVLERMNVKTKKIMDIEDAIKFGDANNDNHLAFDEWRTAMKEKGYADCEIEAVFSKYDLDGDQYLDPYEQQKMKEQLEGEKMKISEKIKKEKRLSQRNQFPTSKSKSVMSLQSGSLGEDNETEKVTKEDMVLLNQRIDEMDDNLNRILVKMDQILGEVEDLEWFNLARQKAISQMVQIYGMNPMMASRF